MELDFTTPFELRPLNDNGSIKMNKLVVSFDVAFNIPGITPVTFSTGCQSEPTHWKQTTLRFHPLGEIPCLDKGDILKREFKMGRNDVNPRDMDFFVTWTAGSFQDAHIFTKRQSGMIISKLSA